MTADPTSDDARTLRLHRDVDAPRELVWRVLTDPAHVDRWWGPTGFRTETHAHDLRVGGAWRMTMHGPDGRPYTNHAVFDVVEPPHRLELRYVQDDDTEPVHHTTTILLEEVEPRRTRVTFLLRFPSAEARRIVVEEFGAVDGGRQTLGRLAAHLDTLSGSAEDDAAFVIRRVIAAPVALVWSAWTDARHLAAWFHTTSWTIFEADLDLRVGGAFFYGFRGDGLPETWGLWRFTEIEAPRRLVFDLHFADAGRNVVPSPFPGPWPPSVTTTVTLEPHAGLGRGTVVTVRQVPVGATEAERAAFRAMGPSMQTGWGETLDSLAVFVAAPA